MLQLSLNFFAVPSSSDEDVEKIVSKTVQTVTTEEPIHVKETRRFSETIAIDHKAKLQEMALQFKLQPQPRQKSELYVRQSSVPRGIRMEVEVPEIVISEKKISQLKRKAEALSTQRQEMTIPIKEQRRFSETIAIDHTRQRPVELTFQLPERAPVAHSSVLVQQQAAPRGMKMEVEIPQQRTTTMGVMQPRPVQAQETQRQFLEMQLDGAPPRFTTELLSRKVMDGEEVKFTCMVTGNPMPAVTWWHNQKQVMENPDFRTTYNKQTGECELSIVEVFPQDTGNYECLAVNPYGRAITKASLVVEGESL